MEGEIMKAWKEAGEEVEEEVGLIKRQAHMYITTTITENFGTQATEHTNGFYGLNNEGLEVSKTEPNSSDIEKNITLYPSDAVISVDSTSRNNVTTESERVGIITENMQLVKELYLESLYQKPPTQGFYCPSCRICVKKVLLMDTGPAQPPPAPEGFRCPECFSFLIPIDLSRARPSEGRTKATPGQVNITGDPGKRIIQDEPVVSDGADKASNEEDDEIGDSPKHLNEIPQDDHGEDGSENNHSHLGVTASASALAARRDTKIDIVDGGNRAPPAGRTAAATSQTGVVHVQGSSKTWEILKSIVYGGLIESIASLSIVTSSASSDATTLNILVLSLANLIGGLFILVHHIWDLKPDQPRTNNQTNASVDRYYQALGKSENFFLHMCIAILSFIIFGLVPPLIYAFTFTESNNKDLKLAAVAGASALCITLLSIAKAYIQRPNKYLTYLKTVLYYLATGAMASVVSYLAGELVKELLEKLGWFNSESSSFTLLLPEMSTEKPRFGSF